MSAPNIINVSNIIGKSGGIALPTTAATELIANPAASGKVLKINMIQVANVSGTANCEVTVDLEVGGVPYSLVANLNVPMKASVVALDKNTSMYLEEGASISVTAELASHLEVLVSYEEIS